MSCFHSLYSLRIKNTYLLSQIHKRRVKQNELINAYVFQLEQVEKFQNPAYIYPLEKNSPTSIGLLKKYPSPLI